MHEEVKELLAGASTQSTHANRLWLALAATATIVIIPSAGAEKVLPFGLGVMPDTWFYFVASLALDVLAISFCSAQAQTIRAQRLAHKAIDSLGRAPSPATGIWLRDLYDASCVPSLSRVAPLAQIARGQFQFFSESHSCPPTRRIMTSLFYLYLKVIAALVYYILPMLAIIMGGIRYFRIGAPFCACLSGLVVVTFAVAALLSLFVLIALDTKYVIDVFMIIAKPAKSESPGP